MLLPFLKPLCDAVMPPLRKSLWFLRCAQWAHAHRRPAAGEGKAAGCDGAMTG
jgi:hypothetical protein